jgi:hypothetical protein
MKYRLTGVAVAMIAAMALSTPVQAHDTNMMNGGMMAHGNMQGHQMPMMGQGMMMPQMMRGHHGGHGSGASRHMGMGSDASRHMGMGSGMPGGGYGIRAERELDVSSVTKVLAGKLAWTGNTRLKVGKVEEKDDDTIIAEIVTLDGSLVDRLAVHRRSGAMRRLP